MPDVSLLIPGTGGNQLLKNGQSLGHPKLLDAKLWLFKTVGLDVEETVRDMSMSHEPGSVEPARTTLAENATIEPGPALTAAYNLIEQRVGSVFTYDWRADIEYSARRLLARLRETKPGDGRFSLVCHSQGGLVALVASKLCEKSQGREGFSKLVSRIAFVGVPLYGTLNAAHALLVGTDLGEQPHEEFRRIAATWPAIYQMLPAFFALRSPDGSTTRQSFINTRTYENYPWIDKDLVRRAFYFRQEFLTHPVSALQGVEYRFLFGSNKPTWEHAVRAADGTITFEDKLAGAGDGLVPWRVFQKTADDVLLQRCEVVDTNENSAEHAMMLTDDFFATRILELLR